MCGSDMLSPLRWLIVNGQYRVPAHMSAHEKKRLDLADRCSMSQIGIVRAFQRPIAVVESDRNPIFALKSGPLVGNFAVAVSSSSVLHRYGESSEYILYGQTFDGNNGGVDCKPCSSMSGLWLREIAPYYWS